MGAFWNRSAAGKKAADTNRKKWGDDYFSVIASQKRGKRKGYKPNGYDPDNCTNYTVIVENNMDLNATFTRRSDARLYKKVLKLSLHPRNSKIRKIVFQNGYISERKEIY